MTAHGGAGAQGALTLPPPQLRFACELDHARLAGLFADPQVIDDLLALKARVAGQPLAGRIRPAGGALFRA